MLPIPFYMQIVLFLCLVAGMLIYDRLKPSKGNVRTKEYLFLVFAGIAGGVYGLVNDCFTASISPGYFWLGKGLNNSPNLYIESILHGAKTGFSGGAILGGIFLVCRTYIFPAVSFKKIIFLMIVPLLVGIVLSVLFPYILVNFDPFGIQKALDGILAAEKISAFLRVWRMHLGSYAGAAIGTVATIIYLKISAPKTDNSSLS